MIAALVYMNDSFIVEFLSLLRHYTDTIYILFEKQVGTNWFHWNPVMIVFM